MLTHNDLLALGDHCRGLNAVDRAIAILRQGDPRAEAGDLAALSLGERDRRLLQLRAATFGSAMEVVARCPHCLEWLELVLDTGDLLSDTPQTIEALARVTVGGRPARLRCLDSLDLAAAAVADTVEAGRRILAARAASVGDEEPALAPETFSASELDEIADRLSRMDPQADIVLGLSCPACGHGWESRLDIVDLFWRELTGRVEALLDDIHELAHHYHWSERDILGLSARRRQAYLERIRQ